VRFSSKEIEMFRFIEAKDGAVAVDPAVVDITALTQVKPLEVGTLVIV
jgi:hypothetical protein